MMRKDANNGSAFLETMTHYIESLSAERDFAGVVKYYEDNRSILANSGDAAAGKILRQAAIAYASLSDYLLALRTIRLAQNLISSRGDSLELAETFLTLGSTLRDMSELKEAEKAFRDSESIFRRNDHIEGQSRALNLLAGLFFRQQDYRNALTVLMDAVQIARKLDDKKKLAYMMGNIGRIHTFTGSFVEAEKHLQINIDLSTELGDKVEVSRACLSLGYVRIQKGEYEKARAILQQAGSLIEETGNGRDKVYLLTYTGELAYRQSRFDESESTLSEAYELACSIATADSTLATSAARQLAELYIRTRAFDRAQRFAAKALSVLKDSGDTVDFGALLKIKAIIAESHGRCDEARVYFERALEVLDKSRVRYEKVEALIAAGCSEVLDIRKRMTYLFRAEEFYTGNLLKVKAVEIGRLISRIEESAKQTRHGSVKTDTAPTDNADYLTRCPEILQFKSQLQAIARTDIPILLTGETGVGKDHLAKCFHAIARPDRPFRAINCASLPDSLLESELFGYHKGAFTGADTDKEGLLVAANNGVLFLDEIGDMPLTLQTKLLGVLENRKIVPLGGTKEIALDIKLVAATNRDLDEMVENGSFRRDLYYRLSGITFHIPPLRERKEDICLLLTYFMERSRLLENGKTLPVELVHQFVKYDWPGNIRELGNKVKRLEIMAELVAEGDLVELSRTIFATEEQESLGTLFERVEQFEHKLIMEALVATGGNKSEAARILGVHEATVRTKLKRYGLSVETAN